ncbi:SLBB domain-containing protein [Limnohabitans sp.]|uniref:polysaccharide biosynthesis/export family protein n=1 Tax=Limnohabitans sp. TaxID=1907725 RepID=UPI00352FF4AA
MPADPVLTTPNQFQLFVQQSTGRLLPIFGARLFEGKRFNSLANVPVPSAYVVGPGDDIDLKVWGAVDMALRLTVDRNGQIMIPKIGPVTVAGTRADELDRVLIKSVGYVYRNFELTATLGGLRSIQVYVVGEAKRPGLYTVSGLSTLLSAVFESGGPSAMGSMRHIELIRRGQKVTALDVYDFIYSGSTAQDAPLQPGDVIVIPPVGPRVAVLGALDKPAIYELKNNAENLQALLGYSGGLRVLTNPHKAQIERVDSAAVAAPRIVESRTLDAAGLQSTLRDGDVVTLFPISPAFANAVTLRGNVADPLRYAYTKGMRISDLIPEPAALIQHDYYQRKNIVVQYESGKAVTDARVVNEVKNLLEEINWDYAAVERLNAKEVKTELIPFNLSKAIRDKDPANNIELQPGDVVTIFGVKDVPVPMAKRSHFVNIGGEVNVPGIYQIQPGDTLEELLKRAGGLTANAYAYGTTFTRESTRKQQQANLDEAVSQMQAQTESMASTLLQNASPNSTDAASVQAQLATQRQTVARLRNLKASGRIALEMHPDKPEFPVLLLEDGDTITVPLRPSFVAVFGSVLAKTSFIYRKGDTVVDYINRAGPTRDADLEGTLLIRADGTVVANEAQRSFAGFGNRSFMTTELKPGDSVFVPEVLDKRTSYTRFMQGAKDWTALLYQFGMGAAGFKALGY